MVENDQNLIIVCTVEPLLYDHSQNHIGGMVAREGFRYAALLQRHTKYGRMRGMVVGEGGRW